MKLDWQKKRIKKIALETKKFCKDKKCSILDVGCFDRYLEKMLPKNISYKGVDINKNADIMCDLNSGKIPTKEKFDVVICSEIFEHILNPKKLLEEMKRVMKDKAIGIITIPNENHIKTRLRRLFNLKYDHLVFSSNPQHHIHSPRIIEGIKFVSSEFKIIKKDYTTVNNISAVLSKISPSLFARGTMMVVVKK